METGSPGLRFKLAFWAVLSILTLAGPLRAHEVTPAIADMKAEGGVIRFDLRLNVEAFVAGIDLDGLADTDASGGSADYDALRALDPAALEGRVRAWAPDWLARIELRAGAVPLPLALEAVRIPPAGNTGLPRPSNLMLAADLPPGAAAITLHWPGGSGDLVLRQFGVPEPFTGLIAGGETSPQIALSGGGRTGGWAAFLAYVPVGFDHILPKGLDHILFVLGLFFLSTRLAPLLWQVSAFTLAHTVTLALGALGWVQVPGAVVEPLIAASITYVAVENILTPQLTRWRPAVVFGFGLLHGLGFASVLGDFGLPEGQFLPALLGFNIGVELGQLTVIAIAFLAVGLWFGRRGFYRRLIAVPASGAIALIGAYWVVERTLL